jgi:hypothetical protein
MVSSGCESGDDNSTYNSSLTTITGEKFKLPELFVALAFGAALLSTLIAMVNIYKHLKNYTRPEFQKSLVRIVFIVPVYAVFSWMSLAIPSKSLIFESVRDCWEAVVIYEFLKLILAYCGGESACLLVIMKNPGSVAHMWPFNYCFRPLRLDARFMRICKRFTLQFVLIKPIMAIVNIVMLEVCLYTNKSYQMSQLIVYNISYSFALYGLVLFYLATHHHPGLKSRKPLLKFAAIKTIIFATYYQGLLVQLVPGFDRHYLEALNNFIFCWEMIVFSIVHVWAFGWFEYVGGGEGIGDLEQGGGGMGSLEMNGPIASLALNHYDNDLSPAQSQSQKADLQGHVKDIINMEDVVHDAIENFNTKYEKHVRLDTSASAAGRAHVDVDDEDETDAHNPFSQFSPSKVEPETVVVPSTRPAQPGQPQQPQQPAINPFQQDDDLANV